jgi:hypothetical protein
MKASIREINSTVIRECFIVVWLIFWVLLFRVIYEVSATPLALYSELMRALLNKQRVLWIVDVLSYKLGQDEKFSLFLKHSDALKRTKPHETHKTQNIQQWHIYFLWSKEVWKLRRKEMTTDCTADVAVSMLQFLQTTRNIHTHSP